jgi:hypothetical protein
MVVEQSHARLPIELPGWSERQTFHTLYTAGVFVTRQAVS